MPSPRQEAGINREIISFAKMMMITPKVYSWAQGQKPVCSIKWQKDLTNCDNNKKAREEKAPE